VIPDLQSSLSLARQNQMRADNATATRLKSLRRPAAPPASLTDLLQDPAAMATLSPQERAMLEATASVEGKRLPADGPVSLRPTAARPRPKPAPGPMMPNRAFLELTADPTKLASLRPEERRMVEETALKVAKDVRGDQFQETIDRLVSEQEAEKAVAPSYPEQLANRFARGMTGTIESGVRGATLIDSELQRKILPFTPKELEQVEKRMLPVDPTDESLLSKGVEVAGSALPFVAASAAGGAVGAPAYIAPAILGAATNAGQTYEEAILAGEDTEAAKRAAIFGAIIGLTEGAGIGRIGGKAGAITGAARRGLASVAGSTAKEFGEEATQEVFNQVLNNVNKKILSGYAPGIAIEEGVAEAGLLGGLVGGTLGGGLGLAGAASGVRERAGETAAVRNEQPGPLGLMPTTIGPTNLISLREAAKPEFRKGLEEATGAAPAAAAETAPQEPGAAEAPTAPAAAQPAAALADPLANAIEQLKSLRRPTEAETKQSEKEAKKVEKEAEKQAKKAEKEAEKQVKLDEQAQGEVEGEIKRMRLYDAAAGAAETAQAEAEAMIEAGDYSGAIGKLRAQQEALRQSVKYMAETPDAVKEKADIAAAIEGINSRIPDIRKQALTAQKETAKPEATPGAAPQVASQAAPEAVAESKPKAAPKSSRAEEATTERRQRAEVGRKIAARYRERAEQAAAAGKLLETQAAYRAELQALNDVMRITPPAEVGARTQLRNVITETERRLQTVSDELKRGSARAQARGAAAARPAAVKVEEAPTAELPPVIGRPEIPTTAPLPELAEEEQETAPFAQRPAAPKTPATARLSGEQGFTPGVNPQIPPPAAPAQESRPARPPTERRLVPKATEANIEELRDRREVLSRIEYDRRGEMPADLSDEYRELGSAIARFENEQAKAERGNRFDPDARPAGIRIDERPFTPPAPREMRRAVDAVEAGLAEETARAAEVLPPSDTEVLDRGVAALDVLFADVEQDVDALDLLDRAIEGDQNARQDLIDYAGRGYGIDPDTIDSIVDARRAGAERGRGQIRKIAEARRGASPDETGAARYGEDGETQPARSQAAGSAREISAGDVEVLDQDPNEVSDVDFDPYLRSLEALNNDIIRGRAALPDWAERQLEARLKQANEVRRGRVKEKRLGPKNEPLTPRQKPLGKVEGGRRLVEQARQREAEKDEAEKTPTVVHPNPEIDRKPILAETNRGTVLVANPANKTGVSEVKDRSGEPSEHKFSSTQVNLPPEIAGEIIAFGRRIPASDLAEDGREGEPHITVKYGLHGWDPKFVEDALAGEGPVEVTFGKVSLFENDDFDVVKVEIESEGLRRLNKKVSDAQPNTENFPEYKPHATIAYVKKGEGAKYVGNNFLEGRTITLDKVIFSGRDGERVEIPLKAKSETDLQPGEREETTRELAAKPAEEPAQKLEEAAGRATGTYMGFGLGSLQPLFNRPAPPKTTPLRQIADALGNDALKIDAASIADEAIDALTEAVSRGKTGSLPFARAVYWAEKLKAKKVAGYLKNRQAQFITRATDLVQEIAVQSAAMDQAKRGSLAWEKAKRELDKARVRLSNHLAKAGEYTHPAEYGAKGYKASLLSALHIPGFNFLSQVAQFPFHEAQKAIDFLVPAKVFNKWGIPYDKAPTDIRTWAPAIARELGAIASGAKSSFGDIGDMLVYGVTAQGLDVEAAQRIVGEEGEGGMDKYELGNRPRLIPGLDQTIMTVGRIQGAADVPFYNMVFASALAAEADATARKIARENPQLKLSKDDIKALARDLAHDPSPAMIAAAGDEAARFKLDYPTLGYKAVQYLRNLPEKYVPRQVDGVYKAAVDTLIPFSKIPLAAADTAFFRYSPVGFGRVASRLAKARAKQAEGKVETGRYKTPEAFARDTAELYRQSIVGTVAWTALGLLGSMGYIAFTGGGEDDKRMDVAAAREALGERFNPELIVGDTAVDVGRFGPVGQAAALGARVAAAGTRRYDKSIQDMEPEWDRAKRTYGALKKGALFENPIGRALEDATEDEEDFLRGKLRGALPGVLRSVARMTDETKRIPDDNSFTGKVRGDIQSGIPSLREKMQPRLDVMGRPMAEASPFSFMRSLRRDAEARQLEDVRDLDVGLSKPKREQGESAERYNLRVRGRGEQFQRTLEELRDDEISGRSREARRAVYEKSLDPTQMERAGKLSSGSVRVEREIEALRGEAFAALRSVPGYERLSAQDQKAVRDLINKELKRFRAEAGSRSRGRLRREKRARIPDWTPEELARAAVEATQ
jgi:2'-5' RNA ligase